MGNLAPTRDFTFVTDTARGFIAVGGCDAAIGRDVNLGTGKEVSIGEVVEAIKGITGVDHEILQDPQRVRRAASEVDRLCSNPSLAESLAGWRAETDVRGGLQATVEWIQENRARFKAGYRV